MPKYVLSFVTSIVIVHTAMAADLRRFEDAALHAVQFVDKAEGWAVGDEGVVWHTIDSGTTWERQSTGVRASLRSVHFLNPFTGWVAGREELSQGKSVGVLLFTDDGGLHWRQCGRNTLPGLNHVRFIDGKTGYVAGDGTDAFPSGVFQTVDGGQSWQLVPGPRSPGWLAAEFSDAKHGALVGAWSRLATLQDGAIGAADVDTLGGRSLRGLQLDGRRAVAVGQGGVVLQSDTGGARWGYANLKLPQEVLANWDFHSVHCRGDQIWIAGRPGSALLHSADWGRNWRIVVTGQPLPLNSIHFADLQRGWAVGEFGAILATEDGGKTWKTQRRGGLRAAVLFVHAGPEGIPLDTVAHVGGEEGYLAAALRVNAPDPASAQAVRARDAARWAAAMCKAGGAAGEMLWQFPLPLHRGLSEKRDLLKAWDSAHADRAAEQYLRQLVLSLRIWRPAVVITDHPTASATPAAALVGEALKEAVSRAADPAIFAEQIQSLGLEPWQVQKLYGCWEKQVDAHVTVDTNEVGPRLEASPRDFAAPAAALLAESSTGPLPLPGWRHYRLLAGHMEGAEGHRNLMEGVALAPGGTSRRELAAVKDPPPEVLKASRAQRNLMALAETPLDDKTDSGKLLAQLGPTLAQMPDDQASAAAVAVASHFARIGQWTLAREAFLFMVDRYPAHPRAADAYQWLIRYNSSSEARRRYELGQFLIVANLQYQSAANPEIALTNALITTKGNSSVGLQQAALSTLSQSTETRQWHQGCLQIGKRLQAFGPAYAADPALHFCLNAARRNLGEFEPAREWYAQFRNQQPDGAWKTAAAAEMWLANRAGPPPKPVIFCRPAAERPKLDGNFDDACWEGLQPLVLKNAVGDTTKEYVTEARLAYDKEYLYLALRCTHPEGRAAEQVKVRQRDADLRAYDRVSLLLDLDRDYATYFHLQVDQRGCVCEDCWGDKTWNPRWFVAAKSDATSWCIEAAIPMTELTGDTVTVGKAWACNVVRVLPGRGVQAMSLPADVQPRPEGLGLLLFGAEPTIRNPKGGQ